MPPSRCPRIASLVCALMIASCAASPPPLRAAPPQLTIPQAVLRPCRLATLPPDATLADLEASYARRGADLVACDAARALAVESLRAQRAQGRGPDAPP